VDDAAPEHFLFESSASFMAPDACSPDGRWIVMTQLGPDTQQNVWWIDASASEPPSTIGRGPRAESLTRVVH
jgi:hypothetical protein